MSERNPLNRPHFKSTFVCHLSLGSILKAYSTLPKIHNKSEHVLKKDYIWKVCALVTKKKRKKKNPSKQNPPKICIICYILWPFELFSNY